MNSFGGEDKRYEVRLDPRKLASAGLGLSDVVQALSRSNANAGGGYIIGGLISSALLTLLVLPTFYGLLRSRLVARSAA